MAINDDKMKEKNYGEVRIIRKNFIHAAQGGELDAVARMVREYGVDINKERDEIGGTALHAAADGNQFEMVKLLRELGADPTIKDLRRKLAVEYACGPFATPELYQYLLDWTFPTTAGVHPHDNGPDNVLVFKPR